MEQTPGMSSFNPDEHAKLLLEHQSQQVKANPETAHCLEHPDLFDRIVTLCSDVSTVKTNTDWLKSSFWKLLTILGGSLVVVAVPSAVFIIGMNNRLSTQENKMETLTTSVDTRLQQVNDKLKYIVEQRNLDHKTKEPARIP